MFLGEENNQITDQTESEEIQQISEDFEAQQNIIGLFDVLFKIAKRNPEIWSEINQENHD